MELPEITRKFKKETEIPVKTKAMRWTKNFAIPSFAKIDLIGIPTGKNLTKINWTS